MIKFSKDKKKVNTSNEKSIQENPLLINKIAFVLIFNYWSEMCEWGV